MKLPKFALLISILLLSGQATGHEIPANDKSKVSAPQKHKPVTTTFKDALRAGNDDDILYYATSDNVRQSISDTEYPLQLAIANNCKLSTVKHLIELGADINVKSPDSKYAIFSAIEHNREDVVQLLLSKDAPVIYNCQQGDLSVLGEAVRKGNVAICKLILDHGANPNEVIGDDYYQTTPLEIAAHSNKTAIALLLLKYGALPVVVSEDGWHEIETLPHTVKNNNLKLSRILLRKGADVNTSFRGDESDLSLHVVAAQVNNYKLSKLLLKYDAEFVKNAYDNNPLGKAIENGNKKLYKLYVKKGATLSDTVSSYSTYLWYAGRTKHTKMLDFLESEGVELRNKDRWGNTLLNHIADAGNEKLFHYAIQKGYTIDSAALGSFLFAAVSNDSKALCLYALEKGADVHYISEHSSYPVIYHAASDGIRQLLIAYGADASMESPDIRSITLDEQQAALQEEVYQPEEIPTYTLHDLAANGTTSLPDYDEVIAELKKILENGADINEQDANGNTPLALAGSGLISRFLLQNGAIPEFEKQNDDGLTLAQKAIIDRKAELFGVYLAYGVPLQQTDNNGRTLLHLAVEKSETAIVKMLLAKGAIANLKDNSGDTPLTLALKSCTPNATIVELLLQHGANLDTAQRKELLSTAFYIAIMKGNMPMCKTLLAMGADAVYEANTMLFWTAFHNNVVLYEFLLANGAKAEDAKLLGLAVLRKDVELYRKYRRDGATMRVIQQAPANEDYLFSMGPAPDDIGALIATVGTNKYKKLRRLLLKDGMDVNYISDLDRSFLHMAAQEGNLKECRYLVRKGADINIKNYADIQPLHLAVLAGHVKTVKWLLREGADLQQKTRSGHSPLSFALENNNTELIILLQKVEAEVILKEKAQQD